MKKLFLLLAISILPLASFAGEICTYTSSPSGVAGLDNTLVQDVSVLTDKGFVAQESNAEFEFSLSIMYCQPGGACGIKLVIEPDTPFPRSMLYAQSKLGLWFKAKKARSLIDELPTCEEFRKSISTH